MTQGIPISRKVRRVWLARGLSCLAAAAVAVPDGALAQAPPISLRDRALLVTDSLKTLPVPDPPNFDVFVRDRQALRRLGKALFWDAQVGSDGQACASCHFHAGADNRSRHQLNPGFKDQSGGSGGDAAFGNSALGPLSLPPFGPDYQLTSEDFP